MATQAFHTWVAKGRPWHLAKPIAELRTAAFVAGVSVLGIIGDKEHLEADWPEDHTPFTFTAWPDPIPTYTVTAIDLADDRIDGRSLGEWILGFAREGKLPWLKYMNFARKHYSIWDDFQLSRANSDTHVHLSIRSDWTSKSIDPDHNPFTLIQGGDMPTAKEIAAELAANKTFLNAVATAVAKRDNPSNKVALGTMIRRVYERSTRIPLIDAKLDAIAAALEGQAPEIAEYLQSAVANVTAAEVAERLELTVKEA